VENPDKKDLKEPQEASVEEVAVEVAVAEVVPEVVADPVAPEEMTRTGPP
jgi:hypothetical protein